MSYRKKWKMRNIESTLSRFPLDLMKFGIAVAQIVKWAHKNAASTRWKLHTPKRNTRGSLYLLTCQVRVRRICEQSKIFFLIDLNVGPTCEKHVMGIKCSFTISNYPKCNVWVSRDFTVAIEKVHFLILSIHPFDINDQHSDVLLDSTKDSILKILPIWKRLNLHNQIAPPLLLLLKMCFTHRD